MTLIQRAAVLGIAVVTLVAFGLGLPWIAQQGPSTRHLDVAESIGTTYGTVTMPAGWDVHIAPSAQRQPVVTSHGVEIVVTDGVWLEDSEHLLRNIASLLFATEPVIPAAPDDDGLLSSLDEPLNAAAIEEDAERVQWRIEAAPDAGGDDPRTVDVVRYGELVVLVIARGDADAVAHQAAVIESVTASVTFEEITAGLEPSS